MIDSEPLSLEAWQRALAPHGVRLTDEQYQALIGVAHDHALRYITQQTGITPDIEVLDRDFWEQLLRLIDERLEPMPGLLLLLDELAERGHWLGVASNSPTDYVHRAMDKIGVAGYLRCIVGADQVARGKPAPDVYLEAARCLGLPPEFCLAIEDSPTGVRAALAAEMRCVFIPNPDIEAPDLEGVEAVFPSVNAFHEALDEVLPREPRQV